MDALGTLYADISLGLSTALSPANLFYCTFGVVVGTLVGVLPGIGALAAISLLFPLTFHLDPTTGLIMLAGIYYGTAYGGSIASILVNVPGGASSAVSCLDGYPMAKQGRAGIALLMTTAASFFGASVGIILMMLFSPVIVVYALEFGPTEYFAIMLMGLVAASTLSVGSPLKSFAMVVFGVTLGTVGTDIYTGLTRFTFGSVYLSDGLSLGALAMGIFGISEIITSVRSVDIDLNTRRHISLRSMIPTRDDVRRSVVPTIRGTGIGAFFGALPGTGPTIASFMAYALEKKVSREPARFGRGAIEGVVAPEAANNAADQTAFIPTMTLGIPGTPTMAIMLGALMIQGVIPGPTLVTNEPDLFWGLVMSFWIGNVILVVLNAPLVGIWVRLLTIPYEILYPAIVMFVCIGAYSLNNSAFDVWTVLGFGALGYALRLLDFPAAPLLLGFVLGPLMEEHFRRSMLLSDGDFLTFLEHPISGTVMAVTAVLIGWGLYASFRQQQVAVQH